MDSTFHSTVMQRPQEDDDDRVRRDRISPNQQSFGPFSPTNGHRRPSLNSPYQPPTPTALPPSLHAPIPPPQLSPLASNAPSGYMTEHVPRPQTSNYYDPTQDASEIKSSDTPSWRTPQVRFNNAECAGIIIRLTFINQQNRDILNYPASTAESTRGYQGAYTSPVNQNFTPHSPATHSHPVHAQSPLTTAMASPIRQNNGVTQPLAPPESIASPSVSLMPHSPHQVQFNFGIEFQLNLPSQKAPNRTADVMSFSSILTESDPVPTPSSPASIAKEPRKALKASMPIPPVEETHSKNSSRRSSVRGPSPAPPRVPAKRQANGNIKSNQTSVDEEQEVQSLLAALDAEMSDLETPEFEDEKWLYKANCLKRKVELEEIEETKRKLRRKKYIQDMSDKLMKHAEAGEKRYRDIHAEEAIASVAAKEVQAEKERKKDMQRKRRREKTVANNLEQKENLLKKAQHTADENERKKLLKEAERAEKKAQHTKIILARGDKGPEIRTVSPIEPNFSGGSLSTFAVEPDAFSGKVKGKGRGGARLRKSKEQKQAEKDSAEAAQAAIDAGEEPAPPPPSEPKIRLKLGAKEPKEKEVREESPAVLEPFVSKSYNQVYDQIWKDIGKKDIGKVYKIAIESNITKASNLKKTAILASKEAKRWQQRTNKGNKDLQARAKRVMREMMSFWKRNEREERDLRRAAEKQEIENAKRAEADREANRQKRKLNFLISQTELYSHFIGKKIKTDEVERSTDHPDVAPTNAHDHSHKIDVPEGEVTGGKVTNFEDLDFDAEDESALKAAAMANAQNAIQEAQNKARAFNNPEPAMDEEGEMNFQNPSGMGEVDIEQPKMLQATLKEYQLKGLNWLVNLYEQGINGILADEMGLGKTVQSISVMAYLAEKHGIWGPFLVVAPASTLHNWQQEITKFVPTLKVLPYWGTAADRKVLRKFWDRRHITYTQDAPFHVLITSYQLVVSDVAYFQKMRWQYMILDEAQAIKSSQSSRWKSLLGFHCRNRLLLTGTPIQNNMQELWALLHFIMPSLFDSHDEFSEWFSKDIESHATSNTKLNEDQLKRLHMILKPFMLRRVKKHVQKELGDKIEIDIFCDLTYRQRAYYSNLRNQISIMDLIEKATIGDDQDTGTLMNLVMQFRKVCNHPDLFERAETTSPFSFGFFAETGSFLREGPLVPVPYSTRNLIEYTLPRLIWREGGRVDMPGPDNEKAGFKRKYVDEMFNIWKPNNTIGNETFAWLRLANSSDELESASSKDAFARAVDLAKKPMNLGRLSVIYDEDGEENFTPAQSMLRIVDRNDRQPLAEVTNEGYLGKLLNVSRDVYAASGMSRIEQCARAAASAPPIQVNCSSRGAVIEKENILFNIPMRRALYGPSTTDEKLFVEAKAPLDFYPQKKMLPAPGSEKQRFTNISVPSMRRFVTDSGKLAKLDDLLFKLKEGGHRVLLYFQMTRMIDLMEEYLTYRNYKYLRLDGSTKLEDRRDTVHDFQTRPEIFIFLLSTRAGGLGINLTSADTVIFYDSDWNPTIDSQAMDRAHRLGQTRQVTVYRMITRGTIEERIRKRALQKEEVQRVVISGGSGGGVDFNTRSRENRTKDIALWLADDDQAAEIERKERELLDKEAKEEKMGVPKKRAGRKKKVESTSLEELYHEGMSLSQSPNFKSMLIFYSQAKDTSTTAPTSPLAQQRQSRARPASARKPKRKRAEAKKPRQRSNG
jgi:DNA helicase INO80